MSCGIVCSPIKREVPRVEYDYLRIRYIRAVAFRLAEIKREIMLAPNYEQPWLCSPHPRLPRCVGVDVGAVVIEEVALNLRLPRRIQKGILVGPKVRIIEINIRVISDVAYLRGC